MATPARLTPNSNASPALSTASATAEVEAPIASQKTPLTTLLHAALKSIPPISDAPAPESIVAAKTGTKVRKVIKKIIVKKVRKKTLAPSAAAAAAEKVDTENKPEEPEPDITKVEATESKPEQQPPEPKVVRKVIKKIVVKKVPKKTMAPAEAQKVDTKSKPEEPEPELTKAETTESIPEQPLELKVEVDPKIELELKPAKKTKKVIRIVKRKRLVKKSLKDYKAGEAKSKKEGDDSAVPTEEDKAKQNREKEIEARSRQNKEAEMEAKARGVSVRKWRRMTEIFVGGISDDLKEEDIRNVFGTIGTVKEVRIIVEKDTGKGKGYAFLRYSEPSEAKRALKEFENVEVCGNLCSAAPVSGNDTIYLGYLERTWKKDDVIRVLEEVGIKHIDSITVVPEIFNPNLNRGYAYLDLETNKAAKIAYKKLSKKGVFGKGKRLKVSWATPLEDSDEEEMLQVKSVYIVGMPSSWDEAKLFDIFEKYGDIEEIVLSRNFKLSTTKDYGFVKFTTREAALSCIESFYKEKLTDNGLKINVSVSLAKPDKLKHKQSDVGSKSDNKADSKIKSKASQNRKAISPGKVNSFSSTVQLKSSSDFEQFTASREPPIWNQRHIGSSRGSASEDYTQGLHGGKRAFSTMGSDTLYSDARGYPRARVEVSHYSALSYPLSYDMAGSSLPYSSLSGAGNQSGGHDEATNRTSTFQSRPGPAYGSESYPGYGSGYYYRY